MTDTAANHSANSGARRSKIVEFHGEATSHPGWLYSVRLQALATNSDDVLDDFDNPTRDDHRARFAVGDMREATLDDEARRAGDDAIEDERLFLSRLARVLEASVLPLLPGSR